MSCADIMAVLFEKIDLDRDKFVLSAGWKACMLYFHLWRKRRITEEELNSYCQRVICDRCRGTGKKLMGKTLCKKCNGSGKVWSKWIGLVEPVHPALVFGTGSMGGGLPAGTGFALAKKFKKEKGIIYVIESDGGMQVGQTWEAVQIAAHHKLNNLVLIVDDNSLQAMGPTKKILNIHPLDKKLKAFGWNVKKINGHNFRQIEKALRQARGRPQKPFAIIAKTVKGFPISFMSGNNVYHYKNLSKQEYVKALKELTTEYINC